MNNTLLIAGRELKSYFSTFSGYMILAAHLLLSGLLFNIYALGNSAKFSQRVLEDFFFFSSGMAIITAILLSIRLIAEERQTQTLVLLRTSPVSEREIILGKFFSALIFLLITLVVSLYQPALIFINGKVALGHILGGYLGLLLLGATCIAISLLVSSFCSSQLTAGAISGLVITLFLVAWMLAKITEPPIKDVLSYLALHNQHFRPFSRGILSITDVVFYLTMVVLFLEFAVQSLSSWRWRE